MSLEIIPTLFTILVYFGLGFGIWQGGNRPFYIACTIMLTCVVVIVSNNMVRGDPLYGPLIFLGVASGIAMHIAHWRRPKIE